MKRNASWFSDLNRASRSDGRYLLVLTAAALFCHLTTARLRAADEAAGPPNILVIVADNLGWKDVGYNGSEIRTPQLDRLAASGARLDHFYVYPMCSPTRAGFVSGRGPSRYNINGAIGQRSKQALPPETVTIADVLKSTGYETAIVGKWHLGLRPEVGPLQYGFDSSYGFLHGQIDKYTHRYKNGDRSWHRNDRFIDEEGHSLDLITSEAARFIERKRDQPFFLYVPYGAPHPPLQEEDRWIKPYEGQISELSRRMYAASVTHMDDAIGRLITALERTQQRDNTLVIFFSDNGAIQNWGPQPVNYQGRFGPYPVLGDNGTLRGWIGELYDGCLRTPALVNWPRVVEPRIVEEVTSVLDLYPTLVARAQGRLPAGLGLEGRDIWSAIAGTGTPEPTVLYWKYFNGQRVAVRDAAWKLHLDHQSGKVELFNMDEDPNEQHNLADEHPQVVARLKKILRQQEALDPA